LKAVLDTNVVVSGMLIAHGHPAAILAAWRERRFQLVTSAPLLQELSDVLAPPDISRRIGRPAEDVATFLAGFAQAAIIVEPTERLAVVADEADNRVLEAAITGEADYMVSGDMGLLALAEYRQVSIVRASRFAAILEADLRA
jgi:putative PIN family toxin of toxin-antitoxin system